VPEKVNPDTLQTEEDISMGEPEEDDKDESKG
jgi:hypothetical protein